jgi:hypothetical protein
MKRCEYGPLPLLTNMVAFKNVLETNALAYFVMVTKKKKFYKIGTDTDTDTDTDATLNAFQKESRRFKNVGLVLSLILKNDAQFYKFLPSKLVCFTLVETSQRCPAA